MSRVTGVHHAGKASAFSPGPEAWSHPAGLGAGLLSDGVVGSPYPSLWRLSSKQGEGMGGSHRVPATDTQ